MKQRRYTDEEKRYHVESFLRLKKEDPGYYSIRRYANEHEMRYYTYRDWYRDYRYNPGCDTRSPGCPEKSYMSTPSDSGLGCKRNLRSYKFNHKEL